MRLTLRTILAYLDDLLEPSQAREIGEKIAEGKEASALVSRIRDVTRRRRIGAPELTGPGSGPDPNLVSDYLENLLAPNQVVELERLCQTSDVHLAEVAACHKILTLVLGQPIDVSDEIRERMAALGSAKQSEQAAAAVLPAMTEGMGVTPSSTMETGLPDYLTSRSFSQRYSTIALVLLVAAVWMGLVLTDKSLWTRPESTGELPMAVKEPVSGEIAAVLPAVPVAPVAPADALPAIAATAPGAAPQEPGSVAAMPTPMPPVPAGPIGQAPLPVPMEPMPPAVATVMPMPVTPPAPPVPGINLMAPPMTVPVDPVLPLTQPEKSMVYSSGDELVIKKMAAQPSWMLADRDLPVQVEDEIASPAPFRNSYRLGDALTVSLEPGTRVQRLPRTDKSELGLLLNRGQLNLVRSFESKTPVGVRLKVLGRDWTITLLEPGTRCGVELSPPTPNGPPADMAEMAVGGGIVVAAGRISVANGNQPAVEIGVNDGYARWPSEGTALVMRVDLTVPTWALPDGPLVTPAARQLSRMFHKEFMADRTVVQSIGPVVKDRRAGVSDLAVKTLALIDQWSLLVPALKGDHQESRLSAIQGLRIWLAENPAHEVELKEELGRTFPADDVEPITRLLWGFTVDDAKSVDISRRLLDWMKDDEIAIRELAFYYVSKLTGRTYDYLPMSPAPERRAAVQRWEDYLKRSGGTLLPD
ncbi:hypothetical protein [Planctomicrobium piriforme]|uniref:Uncharacterized protein n=1 Tax=Planctomicrobium piriforme TaxID=1576369 RepID=A0A1I3BL87_9PLAN|nr:hypothetical protein [Planctomicrobium piriforme]SFH62521.1 hypothetical protein SAMN05421753_101493 [Planctomicrobium piriforme]